MDYDALKTELAKPEYAGLEDAQAAVAVNAKTVDPGRGYVPIADINAWADGIGLTVKVGVMLRKSNADLAAIVPDVDAFVGLLLAVKALFGATYSNVNFGNPDYYAKAEQIAYGLVQAGLMQQTDADYFLAMGNRTVNWATATFGRELDFADIARARTA